MDRTSRIGLFVCLVLLIVLEFLFPTPPQKPKPAVAGTTTPTSITPAPAHLTAANPATANPNAPPPATPAVIEKLTVIENDAMKVTFTSIGAAITEIELKQHHADNGGNIILNEQSHSNVLALTGWPGADTANFSAQTNSNGATFDCDPAQRRKMGADVQFWHGPRKRTRE